jgi:hypothetical protein
LVDIIVTDENLHAAFLFDRMVDGSNGTWATGARITMRVPDAPAVKSNLDIGNCACRWAPGTSTGRSGDLGTSTPLLGNSSGKLISVYNGRTGAEEQ